MFDEYQDKGSVARGLGLTCLLHLLQLPIGFILAMIPGFILIPLIFIGISQLVYMVPAILSYRKTGEIETAKGLIIGASITLLLNAACTGIVFGTLDIR